MNNVQSQTPAAVSTVPATPFHPGEQAVQTTAGVRDEAENRGQKMLTPQLVKAQRAFFARLSFAVSSQLDDDGQPWAGLLTGRPGFIQVSEDGRVRIGRGGNASPAAAAAFDAPFYNQPPGAQVGLLGIQPEKRRRNRINGTVHDAGNGFVDLRIDQGYGNCPKYITQRPWDEHLFAGNYTCTESSAVPESLAELIARSDTFYIASSSGPVTVNDAIQAAAWGSDISHRGGEPGFLALDGQRLEFDDYPGNNLFNTLGNLQQYSRCGLLIPDFITGTVVQIAGRADLRFSDYYRVGITIERVRSWRKRCNDQEDTPC